MTASRTDGRSGGRGRGSQTVTGGGGISGTSRGGSSTDTGDGGSRCSSVPDAKRFLRLYTTASK